MREVFFEGEAYFDIKRNPDKPFIVNSRNTQVEVLGTKFNFSAYNNVRLTAVTLVKGSVKAGTGVRTQVIIPSNQFSLNNGTLEL